MTENTAKKQLSTLFVTDSATCLIQLFTKQEKLDFTGDELLGSIFKGSDVHHLCLSLKVAYDMLPDKLRGDFSKGIKSAIELIPREEKNIDTIICLFNLVQVIQISDCLDAMISCLNDLQKRPVCRSVISKLNQLLLKSTIVMPATDLSADIIRALIKKEGFISDLSPMALIGLCRFEPDSFENHMDLLRHHFEELDKKGGMANAYLIICRLRHLLGNRLVQYQYQPGDEWLKRTLDYLSFREQQTAL